MARTKSRSKYRTSSRGLTLLDKDNDLRCRVNKRANLIFGAHSSHQKMIYIEEEFKKRQCKRQGKEFSPVAEGPQPWYSDVINTSDFANVIMQLLAAKGLDPNDPDSILLVEMLRKDPKSIEKFGLTLAPEAQPEEMEEQFDPGMSQTVPQETGIFEEFEAAQFAFPNQIQRAESISVGLQGHSFAINETTILSQSISTPAPIPRLDVKIEDVELTTPLAPNQPPIPATVGPPAYRPPTIPDKTRARPSKDWIRAMGFPPTISPPPP